MKKKISLCMILFLMFSLLCGCGSGNDNGEESVNGQSYFNAIVLEITDTLILVECTEAFDDSVKIGTQVSFEPNVISAKGMPKISEGDKIRVVYNNARIKDSKPRQLEIIFAVYLLDADGNCIFQ